MLASKILTFNKVEFLALLATGKANTHTARKEYFNIGHPIENPPTLRGSMIIEFSIDFLIDNYAYFVYGSPVDIGSLNAGYIKTRSNSPFNFKMNFNNFTSMLSKISKTSLNDIEEFLSHRITDRVEQVIEGMLGLDAASFIRKDKNPHSRLFEFCLDKGFTVHDRHVKKIHIPNTYKDNHIIKLISKRFAGKIMTFNPKFGFEGRYVA
jgi:hypothetical protein